MSNAEPLRVPITVASQRGVSWLNEHAATRRILLTRFGKVSSVVDSAERLDESAARIDDAAQVVIDAFSGVAASRTLPNSLDDVCKRLNLDPDKIRERATELSRRTQ